MRTPFGTREETRRDPDTRAHAHVVPSPSLINGHRTPSRALYRCTATHRSHATASGPRLDRHFWVLARPWAWPERVLDTLPGGDFYPQKGVFDPPRGGPGTHLGGGPARGGTATPLVQEIGYGRRVDTVGAENWLRTTSRHRWCTIRAPTRRSEQNPH